MSAASQASWERLSAARQRLATIARGLRSCPDILARASQKVSEIVDDVARAHLARHRDTGAAIDSIHITVRPDFGGIDGVHRYLSFHQWWPFRGRTPPFVVKRAAIILAHELVAVLRGVDARPPSLLAAEGVIAEEADATAKRAAKDAEKRAKQAERKAARAAARAAKGGRRG